MKKFFIMFLLLGLTFSVSGVSLAGEEPAAVLPAAEEVVEEEAEKTPEPKKIEEFTEEELAERIKNMLAIGPSLLSSLPEFRVETSEEGEVLEAEYNLDGIWTSVDKLDKELLIRLHARVSSERMRVVNERTLRQLRQERIRTMNERRMRQLRDLNRKNATDRQMRQLKQLKVR